MKERLTMELKDIRPYVLYLPKDESRLRGFEQSWLNACSTYPLFGNGESDWFRNLPEVVKIAGMESDRFPRSPNWRPDLSNKDRRGHTCCFWGHDTMWKTALGLAPKFNQSDDDGALFFEDDARLDADFFNRLETALEELPDDWDIFYLGGQHWVAGRCLPRAISSNIYKIDNVNRLHAYIVRIGALPDLILHFSENFDWGHRFMNPTSGLSECEVDYEIGCLTESGKLNGYSIRNPKLNGNDWIAYQGESYSWTQFREEKDRRWEI